MRAYLRLAAFIVCISLATALVPTRYFPAAMVLVVGAASMAGSYLRNVWYRDRSQELRNTISAADRRR
jgi:hypothetical protein